MTPESVVGIGAIALVALVTGMRGTAARRSCCSSRIAMCGS